MRKIRILIIAFSGILFYAMLKLMMTNEPNLKSEKLLSERNRWDPDLAIDINQTCQFPQPNPWDESISNYVSDPPSSIKCRRVQHNLAFIDENNVLRINKTAMTDAGYSTSSITCAYQLLKRPLGKDNEIKYGDEKPLDLILGNYVNVDMVSVTCKNWLGITIYNDILTHPRKLKPKPSRTIAEPVNILAFGLDSMSRLNFMRQLPLTYDYLTRGMNSVVLHGMTRVGDNTYPNLMAILTGQSTDDGPLERPPMGVYFDSWPIIWKNFSNAGYTTLLAEDEPEYTMFNYASSGHYYQPTDYYYRPFYIAIEDTSTHRLSSNLCFGSKAKHVLHMDFIKKVASDEKKKPFFIFSFLTELSHNLLNRVGAADNDFVEFLRFLYQNGYLDDTILFFFADHGHRFDEIRMTPIGRVESSMPFFSVYLPLRLRRHFPNVAENLRINAMRLTSMFDVHETFLDILTHSTLGVGLGSDFKHISPSGLSLFNKIPIERTCKMAGIREQFCMCSSEKELKSKSDKRVIVSANGLIDFINSLTLPFRNLCSLLTLNKIHSSYLVINDESETIKIRVVLETSPGQGLYEGIVLYENGGKIEVVSDISRINQYDGQDRCLTEEMKRNKIDLRKFCYCK